MKSKKWLIAGIISIILVLAEAAAMFLFVLPGMNKNKMIEALEEGDGAAAADYYDKVNFFAEGDKDDVVKGFLTTATNNYVSGKGSYEDALKKIQAAEKISAFKGKNIDNYKIIALKREMEIYEEAHKIVLEDENADISDIWDEFSTIYYAEDNKGGSYLTNYKENDIEFREKYIDDGLNSFLKGKYDSYNAGGIEDDEMLCYLDSAIYLFEDTGYAYQLSDEMYYVQYYNEGLEMIKGELDEDNYVEAYDNAVSYIDNPADEEIFPRYENEFIAIRDTAYNDVKEKGYEAALSDAEAGKTESAQAMMDNLRRICGDDIDLSEIEKLITPEWKKAYLDYMADWDANLRAVCTSSDYVEVLFEGKDESVTSTEYLNYDSYRPDSIVLYDIDQNGTPEMILRSSATEYIFAYNGEETEFLGLIVGISGFGEGGHIISAFSDPDSNYPNDSGELYRFTDGKLVCESSYYFVEDEGGKTYCVDTYTEMTTEEAFNEAKEKILSAKTVEMPASSPIDSYESVINDY